MNESIWVVLSDEIVADGIVHWMVCRAYASFEDAQSYKRALKEMYKDEEVNFTIQNCILMREV